MEALRQHYLVAVMSRVFEVSESGFYAWRDRPLSLRAQESARLEIEIRAAHQRTRETFGAERLQSDLADHGIRSVLIVSSASARSWGCIASRNGNSR
jgi:putative transposase